MDLFLAILVGIFSVIMPGFFLALALLRKTGMPLFEIGAIGVIFGLIFPPALIWFESYFMFTFHQLSFSAGLYDVNVILLTIIGVVLSVQQGAFKGLLPSSGEKSGTVRRNLEGDYKNRVVSLRGTISDLGRDLRLVKEHQREEEDLIRRHKEELELLQTAGPEERKRIEEHHLKQEKSLYEEHEREEIALLDMDKEKLEKKKGETKLVWLLLLLIMGITFATRIMNIGIAPRYFEFDPYFDMLSTEYILVHGYQLNLDHSAWPVVPQGTLHRIEPIVPYLEAYWYQLVNNNIVSSTVNTDLLSYVGSIYPPLVAALLVFVIFMLLYHQYGEIPGLLGAGLTMAMPALLTTFIAGEQLLEPWGIFSMFFFYATYLLAVSNMKEKRFALLAGIAFASNFLGAHYYTVPTGILTIYILLQGLLNVFRKESNRDFFIMNGIVLLVIIISFSIYDPYGGTLNARIPTALGIPTTIAFPLFALLFVILLEYIIKLVVNGSIIRSYQLSFLSVLLAMGILSLLLIFFTPLGNSVRGYIDISKRFTTPSKPLFMTVQEYTPTGFNFDFGSAGFGLIGSNIFGVSIIVWSILIAFTALELLAVYYRNSKTSIFSVAAVWPLAIAGMIEIKYMPHFGAGYIVAIGIIIGELLLLARKNDNRTWMKILYGAVGFVFLIEFAPVGLSLFSAAINHNCGVLSNSTYPNTIGLNMFCNTVPQYWILATQWMKTNVGPYGPRILSWWDYGDWINWFGNSNAVLRGDNSVAEEDYAAAAQYVLGPADGYDQAELVKFMGSSQAKYILFDDQLVPKWGALNFLACVHINQTSEAYAFSQGHGSSQPYQLGTSNCEVTHSPAYILVPISASINNYCSFSNSSMVAIKSLLVVQNNFANQTFCIPQSFFTTGTPTRAYFSNGTKSNVMLVGDFFGGAIRVSGQTFISFMALYLPNAKNGTITNAPSGFYNSTFYKGFFLGKLSGLKIVYPSNFMGINYVNSTNKVVIYQVNNYTGTLPTVTSKLPWIKNNYTMPG